MFDSPNFREANVSTASELLGVARGELDGVDSDDNDNLQLVVRRLDLDEVQLSRGAALDATKQYRVCYGTHLLRFYVFSYSRFLLC